ncbi:MAG: hypothetical protein M3P34_09740 [Actinomycetota bacterium]|nr:hypothetical protein [Actinomycetota bacterium]
MADDFEAQVADVSLLNDPIRRSLYQFVARSGELVSRDQAVEVAGDDVILGNCPFHSLAHQFTAWCAA